MSGQLGLQCNTLSKKLVGAKDVEDLNSDPRTLIKRLGIVVCDYNSSIGDRDRGWISSLNSKPVGETLFFS